MRGGDIKLRAGLKRQGGNVRFGECPVCHSVFGANGNNALTCSAECDTEFIELNRKANLARELMAHPSSLIPQFSTIFM